MINKNTPLAFVDIETTGSQSANDEIIEIAIIRVDNKNITEFQHLFKPKAKIPEFIQKLTGITNKKVANQPDIKLYLDEIQNMLKDTVFIAHDVNLDFNFLQTLFEKNGRHLDNTLLCSYQLAKQLYPEDKKHGVDFLVEKHHIDIPNRHRAYGDALAIYQFWNIIHQEIDPDVLKRSIKTVLEQKNSKHSAPIHQHTPFEKSINQLPRKPGVFIFFNQEQAPLLIEKANNIQSKVRTY
ncbi:MAG: exonuclease domain-containing protein, partial [Neisseriaceae bacterium]|nr:exonuclease domain-containing protein [Neisseriaceae bacterium]